MMGNITFLWFLLLSMYESLHVAISVYKLQFFNIYLNLVIGIIALCFCHFMNLLITLSFTVLGLVV